VARQFQDRVTIVGVASRDTPEAMAEFVTNHGLEGIQHAADVEGVVWQRFGVTGQPAWAFIDGETGRTDLVYGALGEADLAARLEALAAG
jgi:peroxiredoxin